MTNYDKLSPCQKRHLSKEHKNNIRDANKGKHLSPKTEFKKGDINLIKKGEFNPMWKGYNVGYSALHDWIKRNKPKPEFCENCNIKLPFEIANISGKYKRDVTDFKWLCRSCHTNMDIKNGLRKGYIILRREDKGGKFKCSYCNLFKKTIEFHKANNRWNKISSQCKECFNKIKRDKHSSNKIELSSCISCYCMTKSIRLGRAKYKCEKCGADKSLSDVFYYESTHKYEVENEKE